MSRISLIAVLGLLPSLAMAEPPAGFPADGLSALSPLMAGMMGGVLCNRTVNWDAGGKFLRDKLGDKVTFDAAGLSYSVWMAYAQQSMQAELGALPKGKRDKAAYCGKMIASFGKSGTQIPALLSDD